MKRLIYLKSRLKQVATADRSFNLIVDDLGLQPILATK
jgi:hypothetical protein